MTGIIKKYIHGRLKSEGDGEVAERLMVPLSKSGILSKNGIVGSNPTLSAKDSGLNDDYCLILERCPSGRRSTTGNRVRC